MIKTVNLTADTEEKVTGLEYAHARVTNNTTGILYASKHSGIVAGGDDVLAIPAGTGDYVKNAGGTVYLLSSAGGSVQLEGDGASETSYRPFARAASGGGGGETTDSVARAAIEAHAGNNTIHVTADEKAAWNSKAEMSDIPAALPANGGNADTVGGKNVSEYGLEGVATIVQDYGVMDIGAIIDFNTAPGQDYDGRIARDNGAFVFFNSDNSKATLWANLDGSAASVGAYTEAKLAALEARVAALEDT